MVIEARDGGNKQSWGIGKGGDYKQGMGVQARGGVRGKARANSGKI